MHISEWLKINFSKGERVLITGSTSGIGYHYARSFAAQGCDLICLSDDRDALAQRKAELEREFKVSVLNECVDLRDTDAVIDSANRLKKMPIRVFVSNAGIGINGRFESNPLNRYLDVIKVNSIAPVVYLHALLPNLQSDNRGLIINVASINSMSPIPNSQVYSATKSFIANLMSAVTFENKNSKVQFQLVLPGTTDTPFHARQGLKPQKMTMRPEDVAAASLDRIDRKICIPNKLDKILPILVRCLPREMLINFAGQMLIKRLGLQAKQ